MFTVSFSIRSFARTLTTETSNKRVRALLQQGYLKEGDIKSTKAGFEVIVYGTDDQSLLGAGA